MPSKQRKTTDSKTARRPIDISAHVPVNLATKGTRAREALMDAGLALMGALSPRDLTPGNICTAAQMKRPSFYTYFDSVDELLDAILHREVARLEALYEAENDSDKTALHRLAGIPLKLLADGARDPDRAKAFVKLVGSYPAFAPMRLDNLRRDIEACIDEASLTLARAQIDIFMQIYTASLLSLVSRQAESQLSAHDIAGALDILLRGAGADGDELARALGRD